MNNGEIVTAFVREWDASKPDPARLLPYFTDDAVYHNMPLAPVSGKPAIEATFNGMMARLESRGWEVLRQLESGNVVVNERIDRFAQGEKKIELPVVGVFELRDGKIATWRDYFDMATWTRALS